MYDYLTYITTKFAIGGMMLITVMFLLGIVIGYVAKCLENIVYRKVKIK